MKYNIILLLFLFMAFNSYSQIENLKVLPYPLEITQGIEKFRITPEFAIAVSAEEKDKIISDAINRFFERARRKTLIYFKQEKIELNQKIDGASFQVNIRSKAEPLIGVDESYQLSIFKDKINLNANTTIGALRGLETLFQMILADETGYYIPETEITDSPRYKWRGMSLDVARHFISFDILLKHIDAMSMVKMNVLHLHLSDDDGFRVESKLYPKLQEKGSNGKYYTQEQLKTLVKYASDRGIMVVPEFDVPGHTRSWFAAYPELSSIPGEYKPGPRFVFDPNTPREKLAEAVKFAPTPTIDPSKEYVYDFLEKFFGEMVVIFPSPYFHIGADENNGAAWKQNPKIGQFMVDNNIKDTHELHAYFVNRLHKILHKYNRTVIGWHEAYSEKLPKDIIIQAWIPQNAPMPAVPPLVIADGGNPVLISIGFYLDLFLPSHIHYLNPEIPSIEHNNIWGGEAALWSELVDENGFEERAWPRTASIAERLWSPADINNVNDMYRRLYLLSDDLELAGLNHRLNVRRYLSSLANGNDITAASSVLETLSPFWGYRRLGISMMMPQHLKYETLPLIGLQDIVEVDSEVEWYFRKHIEAYLGFNDSNARLEIENQLKKWNNASKMLIEQIKYAPNLNSLNAYTGRIIEATEIGLKALNKNMTESEKAEAIRQLHSMKVRTDVVEIRIIDEIEGLVNRNLPELIKYFSMY
jgi:hexosaminidase